MDGYDYLQITCMLILHISASNAREGEKIRVFYRTGSGQMWDQYTLTREPAEIINENIWKIVPMRKISRIECALQCSATLPRGACLGFTKHHYEHKCRLMLSDSVTSSPMAQPMSTMSSAPTCPEPPPPVIGYKWMPVMLITSGYSKRTAYELWASTKPYISNPALFMNPTAAEAYRNPAIDVHWDKVIQIRLSMYKNKALVVRMEFNNEGTSKDDWFKQSAVRCSNWTDIRTESQALFSLQGLDHLPGYTNRSFYLGTETKGCGCDCAGGWMMVIDGLQSAGTSDTAPSCDYDKDLTDGDFPVLYYNPGSMAEEFSSEGLKKADRFEVEVKIPENI